MKLFESLKAKIIIVIILVLLIGIAISKLTVHDTVLVSEYNSDQLGISFLYPSDYILSEGKGDGAIESYFIGLTPRPVPASELPPGVQSDPGPSPGINFAFYRDTKQTDSFDEWVREQMIYRAGPDNVQEPVFHPITVDGVPAKRYLDTTGLYQRDTVLFKHGDFMVQIAADDATYFTSDFDYILAFIKLAR